MQVGFVSGASSIDRGAGLKCLYVTHRRNLSGELPPERRCDLAELLLRAASPDDTLVIPLLVAYHLDRQADVIVAHVSLPFPNHFVSCPSETAYISDNTL